MGFRGLGFLSCSLGWEQRLGILGSGISDVSQQDFECGMVVASGLRESTTLGARMPARMSRAVGFGSRLRGSSLGASERVVNFGQCDKRT